VDYVDCPRYTYLNSGDKPATEGGVTVDGAVFIKKGKPLVVIPCGNLGAWKSAPSERYPMFTDMALTGTPADRGVRALRLDAAKLLGVAGGDKVTVDQRDAQGKTISSGTAPAQAVEMAPAEDVVDYVVR